jgi:hypothetical protein
MPYSSEHNSELTGAKPVRDFLLLWASEAWKATSFEENSIITYFTKNFQVSHPRCVV